MGQTVAAFSQILGQAGWEASTSAWSSIAILQHYPAVKRDAKMAVLAAGERRTMDAVKKMRDAGMADGKS